MAEQAQGRVGLSTHLSPIQSCLHALDLLHCPNLYNIFIFLFLATGFEPKGHMSMSMRESVCVLCCKSLYILSALETVHNWFPNPAPLGSSIPQLQCNNLQGTSTETELLCIHSQLPSTSQDISSRIT